jgi:uncharacterized protein YjbJ (UPF0337 family)
MSRRHEQKHLLHNWSDCRYRDRPQNPRAVLRVPSFGQPGRKWLLFEAGGYSRRFVCPYADRLSSNHTTTAAFIARDFVLMKSSTKDKIKGGFREAKGKVKEKAGNATGNPNLRDRGTAEKAGGKVQRKIGDLKKVFEQ